MGMRSSRRQFLVNGARVAGGIVVASCVPGQTAAPSATSSAPIAKDIVIGTPVEVVDGQPYNQTSTGAYSQMFSSLYDTVTGRNDKYELEPRVAESWKALDKNTWQFKIRKGIKFHNGDPLTAADVKWSIEHTYDPAAKTIFATSYAVDRMELLDEFTLNVVTKKPDPFLPEKLAVRPGYVMPSKYFQAVGIAGMDKSPVGSGPYMFKERVAGSSFKVVRNPEYWRGPAPADSITALYRPDETARIAALKAGEVNLIKDLPYDQVDAINAWATTKVVAVPSITIAKYQINTKFKPLDDKRIRHALSLAIDRDLLSKSLGRGLYQIVNGPIPPSEFGYDPSFPKLAYDPAKAKALMAEAGYKGEPIPLESNSKSAQVLLDQAVAEAWKAVGFNIQIVPMDAATRARKIANPAAGFTALSWVGFSSKYGDPDGVIWRTQQPGGSLRYWSSPEYDALGVEQSQSTDPVRRKAIWKRMVQIMLDEMIQVYLWIEPSMWGISKKIDISPTVEEHDDFGPGGHLTFKP